jgi:hypothetical protein
MTSLSLNVHKISDVGQIEINTAESLLPDTIPFEIWNSTAKLEKCKWPGNDQIPSELIQAVGKTLLYAIHELVSSILNEKELRYQWKAPIIVPI